MWRGFVKDQLNLEAVPKAFLKIKTFSIKEDLLTSATSSFECLEVAENISHGDVVIITDETGVTKYQGVITSIEDTTINTSQMQSIYAGNWLYDLPNIIGVGDDKSWSYAKYDYQVDTSKTYDTWSESDLPTIEDIEELTVKQTLAFLDSATSLSMNIGEYYTALCTTYVYSETRKNVTMAFSNDNGGFLYVNGSKVASYIYYDKSTKSQATPTEATVTIRKGWNKIEVLYNEETGGDGWLVTIGGSHLSSYFSKMTSQYTSNVTSLEDTFAQALQLYANGQMRDSSYTDELVKQRLSPIKIKVSSQTQGAFLSQEDTYVCDMEDFIYSLYNRYQIQLDFDIPYSGECSVTIGKSSAGEIKIGNNTNSIINISPITEVEETNRLIIYNEDGTYRATYVTKADGSRVKEPSGTANRFGVVKTSIVFSDDDDQTLQWGYLPKMYNHKLTFTLRILDNGLYKYDDFSLGMPLAVWKDTDYFSTVLTSKEMSLEENTPLSEVDFTCGTVRTKLTEKILMKYGVHNA